MNRSWILLWVGFLFHSCIMFGNLFVSPLVASHESITVTRAARFSFLSLFVFFSDLRLSERRSYPLGPCSRLVWDGARLVPVWVDSFQWAESNARNHRESISILSITICISFACIQISRRLLAPPTAHHRRSPVSQESPALIRSERVSRERSLSVTLKKQQTNDEMPPQMIMRWEKQVSDYRGDQTARFSDLQLPVFFFFVSALHHYSSRASGALAVEKNVI